MKKIGKKLPSSNTVTLEELIINLQSNYRQFRISKAENILCNYYYYYFINIENSYCCNTI